MLVLIAGCGSDDGNNDVEYAIEPQLDFVSTKFTRSASASSPIDTIAVTFRYRDGDGDIGLTIEDRDVPYQSYNFFLENESTLTSIPGRRVDVPYDLTIMPFVVVAPGAATGK